MVVMLKKSSSNNRLSTSLTEQSHPLYASARLWDDGIIDPRRARDVLHPVAPRMR